MPAIVLIGASGGVTRAKEKKPPICSVDACSGWCATRAVTTPGTPSSCPAARTSPCTSSHRGSSPPGVTNVIGNGVVVDPGVLLTELAGLEERGVDTSGLLISADAHLLMPYHVAIDKVTERYMGSKKIGTTGRGIGPPCYQDKIARMGIRVADVLDRDLLAAKIEASLELKNQVLVKIYNRKALDADEVLETLLAQADGFKHRIADTRLQLNTALESGETVLLEGSQGTLLDVDHGTYPTSRRPTPPPGGAARPVGHRPPPGSPPCSAS